MFRVTHNIMKKDAVYNINKHQSKMSKLQNNLSTGKRVRLPHEDPVSATHSMLYRTRITEIRQFIKNIDEGQSRLNMAESSIRSAVDIMHRLEELTVQAANGIYTQKDRSHIAVEIDELLKEMVEIANTKYKGESVFGGFQTDKNAFEVQTALPSYTDREVITKVNYAGDIGLMNREIEQDEHAAVNMPGNTVFWAMREAVVGSQNVNNYTADKDYKIRIDGKEIEIKTGDNIQAIMKKINDTPIPIEANLINNKLAIKNTSHHQLWLEDIEGGDFLQQMGIKDVNQRPNETSQNAQRVGMSIFDVMIKLRDDLWKNDVAKIGSEDLNALRYGLNNMLKSLGEIGARSHRFETVMKRLNIDEVDMTDILAKTENIDFAQVVMDLQMLEHVHRSALGATAKIVRPTLMDFLR